LHYCSDLAFHPIYKVRNESNKDVSVNVLMLYWGNLWKSILDRQNYKCDGFIMTISYEGEKYKIYRNMRNQNTGCNSYLRVVNNSNCD